MSSSSQRPAQPYPPIQSPPASNGHARLTSADLRAFGIEPPRNRRRTALIVLVVIGVVGFLAAATIAVVIHTRQTLQHPPEVTPAASTASR